MKNKLIFLIVLGFLCSFLGCDSKKSDTSASDSQVKESVYSEETTENKPKYVTLGKMTIPLSEKFTKETDAFCFETYNVSNSTEDKIYCCFTCNELYGDLIEVIENYTYKNAPEIFEPTEKYMIHDFFNYPYERNVEVEETVECMGYQFLKQKGTFKVKLDDDSIHDVYFVGYYGCMYISSFDDKSVPVMWISFSEVTNEQTKQDMEDIVDDCATKIIFEE